MCLPERLIFEGQPIVAEPLEQAPRLAVAHEAAILDSKRPTQALWDCYFFRRSLYPQGPDQWAVSESVSSDAFGAMSESFSATDRAGTYEKRARAYRYVQKNSHLRQPVGQENVDPKHNDDLRWPRGAASGRRERRPGRLGEDGGR
jgi:hypothetical protein